MNITLRHSSVNAWCQVFIMAEIQKKQRHLYLWAKQQLKRLMRLAFVKLMLRLNNTIERTLKIIMRSLHVVEKTKIFNMASVLATVCVGTVKRDGLKFTILLTTLGYSAWCLAIF